MKRRDHPRLPPRKTEKNKHFSYLIIYLLSNRGSWRSGLYFASVKFPLASIPPDANLKLRAILNKCYPILSKFAERQLFMKRSLDIIIKLFLLLKFLVPSKCIKGLLKPNANITLNSLLFFFINILFSIVRALEISSYFLYFKNMKIKRISRVRGSYYFQNSPCFKFVMS